MKGILLVAITCLILWGCRNNYYYLTDDQLKGFTLESHKGVYQVNIKVEVETECTSLLTIQVDSTLYRLMVNETLDTILSSDWYMEPMFIKVSYDTCIQSPIIGVRFLD